MHILALRAALENFLVPKARFQEGAEVAASRAAEGASARGGFQAWEGWTSLLVPNGKKSVLCQEGGREDNHLVLRPLPMQTRPSAYNGFYPRFQADMNVSFVYCQVFG